MTYIKPAVFDLHCNNSQMAKLFVYIKCSAIANGMFCAFSVVFIITRLVVLPNWSEILQCKNSLSTSQYVIAGFYPASCLTYLTILVDTRISHGQLLSS